MQCQIQEMKNLTHPDYPANRQNRLLAAPHSQALNRILHRHDGQIGLHKKNRRRLSAACLSSFAPGGCGAKRSCATNAARFKSQPSDDLLGDAASTNAHLSFEVVTVAVLQKQTSLPCLLCARGKMENGVLTINLAATEPFPFE